jgi:sigma-B regulation protein RsbU (phosphoserine phosphatase)
MDQIATPPAPLHGAADATFDNQPFAAAQPLATLDGMRARIDALESELNVMRRRDDTINFLMNRVDEELRLAARLQQDFLPRALPLGGPVHFHTLFRPAGYVSGDLYDVMRLDEDHIGFFIVDAVGHGMPAALLTMYIKRALITKEIHAGGYRLLSTDEAMARLNDALAEQELSQASFATAAYGIINTRTLELSLSCGGHPPPLLLRDGQFETTRAGGTLLGIFPGERYPSQQTQLRSGDRLIVYTDGIEVTFTDDQTRQTSRWRDELLCRRNLDAEQMLIQFNELIDAETGSLRPKDDLTVIIIDVA